MDPNATLRLMQRILESREENEELDDLAEHLRVWIVRGGFAPDWSACPLATSYYECRCIARRREQCASAS
jgi:hypothetical protein